MTKKSFTEGYKTYDTTEGYGSRTQWKRSFHHRMTGQEAEEILKEHAKTKNETPWDILGIKKGATQAEIKTAFRKKINEWHPDKNPHRMEQAEEMSKKIIAAYTKLKL